MPINCKISERVRTFQLVAISDTTTGDDLSPGVSAAPQQLRARVAAGAPPPAR